MGSVSEEENSKSIHKIIKSLAFKKKQKISFDDFNEKLQKETFGIVLTAHPTFGMTHQIMVNLAKLATNKNEKGKKISDSELKSIIKDIFKTEQKPEKNISLDFEHELSIIALKNLQYALGSFFKIVVNVTKEIFPNEYFEIMPQIFRLHTWVGYDVDGRGDISWSNTFSKRLKVKLEQLLEYEKSIKEILKISKDKELSKKVNNFHKLISESISVNKKTLKYFSDPKLLDNVDDVKYISNFLFKNKDKLITNENLLIEKIDDIIASIKFKKIKNYQRLIENLIVLKIVVKNFGLGLGRTQVRLNANQLNNAISKEIDLKGDPDDPSNKRTYLQVISKTN